MIIGAPKAGTTALDALLRRVPGLSMAAVKEPRFFMRSIDPDCFLSPCIFDGAEYLGLWPEGLKSIRGEASPIYMMDPGAAEAIAEVRSDAKIVALLRDPVERAFSHFRYHEKRTGRRSRDFSTAIRAEVVAPLSDYHRSYLLEPGYYGKHLTSWLEVFGSSQLHTIFFDDLVADSRSVLRRLGEFLGVKVPSALDLELSTANQNRAATLRWPWLRRITMSTGVRKAVRKAGVERLAVGLGERFLLNSAESEAPSADDRTFLQELYRADAELLATLLEREVPWFDGDWTHSDVNQR